MATLSFHYYNPPAVVTGLPRINSGQYTTDTLTLDTTGLTGITAYDWRIVGGATLGTAATQAAAGQGGSWVECEVTCDQGALVSPAVMIYMPMMMTSHNEDDTALLALVPHDEATHIAIADGNWTSGATWRGGSVPGSGANVLIPHGRTVTYDQHNRIRLNWVRIDGTLETALTKSTDAFFETLVITRGGRLECGTGAARLPSQYTSEWIVSNRVCRTDVTQPANIDIDSDLRLLGRGIISQGERVMWGAFKTSWLRTAAGSAPMAGATSATLASAPTGWVVGDEIIIGGTGNTSTVETETRTITAISGAVVSWSGGLAYDHDHHNANVTRTDLQPGVANLTRNIIIRSEDGTVPNHRRGHTMDMHMMCHLDLWDVAHVDLGRTTKGDATPAGKIDENGAFKTSGVSSGVFNTVTMTADANLQSRYPVHFHQAGFHKAATDTVNNCVVRGTPGWGITHHGCHANVNSNVVTDFGGAGIVSETGNEIGEWVGNFTAGSRAKDADTPKNTEDPFGLNGDMFRTGYGLAMTSRAMVCNSNFVQDASWGVVFYHRGSGITPMVDHETANIDLKDLRTFMNDGSMPAEDYPIVHVTDNESAGMFGGGLFVTKSGAEQNHGLNVNIKQLKSWGFGLVGGWVEYIGQYALSDWDIIAPDTGTAEGIHVGNQTGQVAVVRPTTERCAIGVGFSAQGGLIPNTEYDMMVNPRYMVVAHTSISDTSSIDYGLEGMTVTRVFATEPAYPEPSHNLPFKLAEWDGSTSPDAGISAVASGVLTDSVSAVGFLPKPADNTGLPIASPDSGNMGIAVRDYADLNGFYTVSSVPYIIFPAYFADRINAANWIKTWHGIELTGPTGSYTDHGAFTTSASAPTVTAASLSVAENGSGTIDILALATGASGTTLSLSDSYFAPDHGRLSISGGSVTYEPFAGFTGSDKAQVAVEDDQGHSTRVDIAITVA